MITQICGLHPTELHRQGVRNIQSMYQKFKKCAMIWPALPISIFF